MEITVRQENLVEILNEIKKQFISVSVQEHAGDWSTEYYIVEGIKEIRSTEGVMTALLLVSPNMSHCSMVNLKSIQGIKLNKYLNLNGSLMEELRIESEEPHTINH